MREEEKVWKRQEVSGIMSYDLVLQVNINQTFIYDTR
jgi:hypothetical protein